MTTHQHDDSAGPGATQRPRSPDEAERPLGVSLLVWLYWFWTGAVVLVFLGLAIGEGPVPLSGETVPRPEALARVLPVLLPMGLAVLGAALALSLRRPWARPVVLFPVILAAFGPALSGVGVSVLDIVVGTFAIVLALAALVWYLYFQDVVTDYFAGLREEGDAGGAAGA